MNHAPALTRGQKTSYWFANHWVLAFGLMYGIFVGLPFLAPGFMKIGWEVPARALYFVYSFLCHQLPDRSFYLFGPQLTVDMNTIRAAWQDTGNLLVLRQFIGNPEIGWKVAWSDRMVSMYGSVLVAGILWGGFRKRLKALPLWAFILLALPIAFDGVSHFVSDLGGLEQGFRYTNAWLAELTGNVFPKDFYIGNAWGSFNAWMRLVTGVLFGTGIVWYGFPIIDEVAEATRRRVELRQEALDLLQKLQKQDKSGSIRI